MPDFSKETLRYAELPGLRMAYWTFGAATSNWPIILCHGFPELAYSWRHQVEALARSGRYVIVPDLRGYGFTGGPDEVGAYDIETLCDDVVGLLKALGLSKAIVAGHDWGGALAWNLALRRPRHIAGIISLCTPFQTRAPGDPVAIMRKRFGDGMYMVHLQERGEPDAILNRDVRQTLSYFFRRPPLTPQRDPGQPPESRSGAGSVLPIVHEIKAYDPKADGRAYFLTGEEFGHYVSAFETTGFTRAINWYRNLTRNWETAGRYEGIVHQPALLLQAELDRYLPPATAAGMERVVPNLEKHLLRGGGHWIQQEQPEAVAAAMVAWLDRHFPA